MHFIIFMALAGIAVAAPTHAPQGPGTTDLSVGENVFEGFTGFEDNEEVDTSLAGYEHGDEQTFEAGAKASIEARDTGNGEPSFEEIYSGFTGFDTDVEDDVDMSAKLNGEKVSIERRDVGDDEPSFREIYGGFTGFDEDVKSYVDMSAILDAEKASDSGLSGGSPQPIDS